MKFIDIVKCRRSVRTYINKEIKDEIIVHILESARLAPSWGNKQCWSFIVVKDRERIKLLSKVVSSENRWVEKAPTVIVACGNPKSSGICNDMEYFLVDVAIAMEHLILAATDVGLGTCWIGIFDEKKIKKILGIPSEIRVVALTPLGYPAKSWGKRESNTENLLSGKKRKSLDEIVHYEKW